MPIQLLGDLESNCIEASEKVIEEGQGTINFLGSGASVHLEEPYSPYVIHGTIHSRARLSVGPFCNIGALHIHAGEDTAIEIQEWVSCSGILVMSAHERSRIRIGARCIIGPECRISTSDVHKILDRTTGQRLNPAADIIVREHVWLAHGVTLLKGTDVGSDSVVGLGSVLRGTYPAHSMIIGYPAKVVRENISWEF